MRTLKVLVVDDDEMTREVLETMLEGCEVSVADDGESALKAAERDRPDVVLLDIRMPGMDGFEVCRQLKAWSDPPKVVMVTAKTATEDERKARGAGADDYLRKPFSPLEILRIVGAERST
ncbi:MAG: response regulator transcription factor [Actinomycetota bacterium]